MKFIVGKASDKEFKQARDVSTSEDLLVLTNGLQHPLIIFPRQLRPPLVFICDDGSASDPWQRDQPNLETVMLTATAMVKALRGK
jgi:hypothetical protein